MEQQITSSVAAKLIGITTGQVRQLCRDGEIQGEKFGRDWKVDRASAEAYRDRPAGVGKPRLVDKRKKKGIKK